MDSPNHAGGITENRQRLYNINILGPELTDELRFAARAYPEGFARLVKALSENNLAIEGALLRRWGIR